MCSGVFGQGGLFSDFQPTSLFDWIWTTIWCFLALWCLGFPLPSHNYIFGLIFFFFFFFSGVQQCLIIAPSFQSGMTLTVLGGPFGMLGNIAWACIMDGNVLPFILYLWLLVYVISSIILIIPCFLNIVPIWKNYHLSIFLSRLYGIT